MSTPLKSYFLFLFLFCFSHHLFSLLQKLLQVQLYHATLQSKGILDGCSYRFFFFSKMNYYIDLILEIKINKMASNSESPGFGIIIVAI